MYFETEGVCMIFENKCCRKLKYWYCSLVVQFSSGIMYNSSLLTDRCQAMFSSWQPSLHGQWRSTTNFVCLVASIFWPYVVIYLAIQSNHVANQRTVFLNYAYMKTGKIQKILGRKFSGLQESICLWSTTTSCTIDLIVKATACCWLLSTTHRQMIYVIWQDWYLLFSLPCYIWHGLLTSIPSVLKYKYFWRLHWVTTYGAKWVSTL